MEVCSEAVGGSFIEMAVLHAAALVTGAPWLPPSPLLVTRGAEQLRASPTKAPSRHTASGAITF